MVPQSCQNVLNNRNLRLPGNEKPNMTNTRWSSPRPSMRKAKISLIKREDPPKKVNRTPPPPIAFLTLSVKCIPSQSMELWNTSCYYHFYGNTTKPFWTNLLQARGCFISSKFYSSPPYSAKLLTKKCFVHFWQPGWNSWSVTELLSTTLYIISVSDKVYGSYHYIGG